MQEEGHTPKETGLSVAVPEKEKVEVVPQKKKRSVKKWIGESVFYLVLVLCLFGVLLLKSSTDGAPVSFAGISMFTVVSGSMQREIPKDSLVITKQTDASMLEVGDDITYMNSPSSTITHRIIGIIENYEGNGERVFETQGLENQNPDKELVFQLIL